MASYRSRGGIVHSNIMFGMGRLFITSRRQYSRTGSLTTFRHGGHLRSNVCRDFGTSDGLRNPLSIIPSLHLRVQYQEGNGWPEKCLSNSGT